MSFIRFFSMLVLAITLTACDNNSQNTLAAPEPDAMQKVSLWQDKIQLSIPQNWRDQSNQLTQQSNDRYIFTNQDTSQSLIVLLDEPFKGELSEQVKNIEENRKQRDASQVTISSKPIEVSGYSLYRLDMRSKENDHETLVSTITGNVNDRLLTIQVSLPAEPPQEAQKIVQSIQDSLTLK